MRPRGRPPKFGKTMRQTAIWLPENQIAWLKKRDNASETIRKMLEEKMDTVTCINIDANYNDLFASGDWDGVDQAASADKYYDLLLDQLRRDYPDAKIEINDNLNNRVYIERGNEFMPDTEDVEDNIREIEARLYEDFESWVVME